VIKVEDIEVWGWTHALRGMRNPMNSWDKSDTNITLTGSKVCAPRLHQTTSEEPHFGEADAKLIHSLVQGGTEHRKFLRQVFVAMDIIAPLYWWKEFDTYKVGTTSNSCSTMHKLTSKPITLDDFSIDDDMDDDMDVIDSEGEISSKGFFVSLLQIVKCADRNIFRIVVANCEMYRQKYLMYKQKAKLNPKKAKHYNSCAKRYWRKLIQLLPSSYNQRRTITMSYENVLAIIHQRSGHKLDEWNEFVEVLTNLLGMDVILGGEPKKW